MKFIRKNVSNKDGSSDHDCYFMVSKEDSKKVFEPKSIYDIPPTRILTGSMNKDDNRIHEIFDPEFREKFNIEYSNQATNLYYYLIRTIIERRKQYVHSDYYHLRVKYDENCIRQVIDYVNNRYKKYGYYGSYEPVDEKLSGFYRILINPIINYMLSTYNFPRRY